MKHSPSDHHRLFLFLDTPLSLRKNSNKETIRTQKTIAAIANSVTATARKLWLNETRKPTSLQINNMLQVSLRQIDICYTGFAEQDEIRNLSQQIFGKMKRNIVDGLHFPCFKHKSKASFISFANALSSTSPSPSIL